MHLVTLDWLDFVMFSLSLGSVVEKGRFTLKNFTMEFVFVLTEETLETM